MGLAPPASEHPTWGPVFLHLRVFCSVLSLLSARRVPSLRRNGLAISPGVSFLSQTIENKSLGPAEHFRELSRRDNVIFLGDLLDHLKVLVDDLFALSSNLLYGWVGGVLRLCFEVLLVLLMIFHHVLDVGLVEVVAIQGL